MKNEGKKFEEDFKSSIPKEIWKYRLRDGTSSWGGNEKTRFQTFNICDFMVMSGYKLYLLELKTHKGASIPLGAIRAKQLEELTSINYKNIKTYFIFNFRDYEKTYALDAKEIKYFIDNTDRKSIPIGYCEETGTLIEQQKKKVRWKYELKDFFKE